MTKHNYQMIKSEGRDV